MSRIFDALQRSKLEGDGFEFPLMSSLAAEVPQATEVETDDIPHANDFVSSSSRWQFLHRLSSRLVSLTDEASLGAEKFRFLGVRLRQLRQTRALKKLLITSTIPEEGKTMVSANLALSLAQRSQQKVLLLEGDLRRPALSTRFGLPRLPGLSEWLQGISGPERQAFTSLKRQDSGFCPPAVHPRNPLELMQSERLAELMDQLTDWFDWILIDSPPLVPLADTSVWMRSADGILWWSAKVRPKSDNCSAGCRSWNSRSCWAWF